MICVKNSKKRVDEVLRAFLDDKKQTATDIHVSYGKLLDEIKRVVFSGGKRLRPHLVFLGYGSYDEPISYVAAAHELLHTALLVHDDIIDRDTVRHGQATIHHSYDSYYGDFFTDPHERQHFSESAALLAGDLLVSFAHELLNMASLSKADSRTAIILLTQGTFDVVGGELLDTEAAFVDKPCDPLTIYRYKTAGYSIISPLLTGISLSPKMYDETTRAAIHSYAEHIGVAYQIQDDILGVFGHSDITGKSNIGDLREGKQTLLVSTFLAIASLEQRQLFQATFGNATAHNDDFATLKHMIDVSGALTRTRQYVEEYMATADNSLADITDDTLVVALKDFAGMLVRRTS